MNADHIIHGYRAPSAELTPELWGISPDVTDAELSDLLAQFPLLSGPEDFPPPPDPAPQPGPLYLHCAELSRTAELLSNELKNLLSNLKRLGL